MMKKVLSVFMCAVLLCCCAFVPAYAKTSEEVDTHLQFGKDGKFRIMQISDMQDFFPMKSITKNVIRKALDTYPVDLIVLTGDNISSTSLVKPYAALAINEFMSIYEKYGIPVVMVYGNHDDENTTADKAFQLSVYERYKCFIGCAGENFGESNLGTYYVPVYSSADKNKMVNNIWMIDSGTYNEENDLGGYACVTKKQVEWYKKTSEKLERENGHKIPSLMFQHIVVPEIWDALDEHEQKVEGGVEHGGKYYTLPEGAKGVLGETPCPPNYTNGQFDAILERGDVMAMFFGHDHVNTYEVNYRGVDLCNTPGVGFRSYNSIDEGVRLITLDEKEPDTYETEVVSYFDLFDETDEVAYNQFMSESRTVEDSEHFGYFIKYVIAFIKSVFAF
ncbi:MAG: metallophosphoesterase family protein [Clostridia bacterium]|nr:metallophosphoesterase family protein [Clostridia bacterium]